MNEAWLRAKRLSFSLDTTAAATPEIFLIQRGLISDASIIGVVPVRAIIQDSQIHEILQHGEVYLGQRSSRTRMNGPGNVAASVG
jgi:hypothetical protein